MQGSELLSPRSEEPPDLKSSNDSAMPADLDIAFAKIVEAIDFNWPESLAVERIPIGIAKIVSGIRSICRARPVGDFYSLFGSWFLRGVNIALHGN